MSEFRLPNPALWEALPPQRQRGVILVIEQMALRRIRSALCLAETRHYVSNAVCHERLAIVYIR